uniref:Glycoside hydrolase family 5 domain-containing protein n=1 Tax=Globisporangium ultimum (strain ATCC 200006 / CBS 805.95 / DAOM BR144) TaxID=431595 RepID=K3XCI2_GLOUD
PNAISLTESYRYEQYHVAEFLSINKFNAVRLPLMVHHILSNTVPNKGMINSYSNQAVSIKNYMALLKSIVKVLQFRRIGVLISMHTLTDDDSGGLWYNDDVSEEDFLRP